MNERHIPHNLEAERSVLGAVLIDNEALHKVADQLHADQFFSPQHKLIYEAIAELYYSSKPIDVVTLTTLLKKKNKLNQVGGSAYLSELIASVPSAANLREYAELVKETSIRRNLITMAGELSELSREETRKLDDILDEVEGKIFKLSQDTSQREFLGTAELLEMYMQKVDENVKNPNPIKGIPTGLRDLDAMLGGLHNSDLIILAARPSVGKSSLATEIARHAAVDEGKSVAIFALEMPNVQVLERILAQQIKVDLFSLRMGRLTDHQFVKLAEGSGKLAEAKIFVDDTPGLNVLQLRSKARKLMLEEGLDLIIIDYLQLMQGLGSRVDSRAFEISEISRSLKILARELDVPVIALSQLNRSVETRGDHRPQLSDLRESGSIEQDADLVIFVSREKVYNPETERPDAMDVIIAKHRNGPIGQVELKFIDSYTGVADMN